MPASPPLRPAREADVREVDVDGVVLRVATTGEGPPLLLINGIGANLEMWGALVRHLPGRRIVMFDFPGTGGSLPLPGPKRMPALADLVVSLLDALQLERVDVLGYSWGGALAQEVAHRAPSRVRSLVLAATVPGLFGQPPPPWVLAAMSTPMRYYSRTYMRLVAPVIYGVAIRSDEGHLSARQQRPPSVRGYAHQLYAITGWSSRSWLKTLRLPVLVLSGRGDQLAPERNGRILSREIRGATMQLVPGGHLFLLQDVGVAAQAVTRFLDVVDRGEAPFQDKAVATAPETAPARTRRGRTSS